MVSSNDSPLLTDETVSGFCISIVSPPSRLTAEANEANVRLDGSKKSSETTYPLSKDDAR